MDAERMAANLRRLRVAKGFGVYELGARAGISYKTIYNIENQRTGAPYAVTLIALAKALGCTVEDITGSEN